MKKVILFRMRNREMLENIMHLAPYSPLIIYFLSGTQGKIRMQYFYIPIASNTNYIHYNIPKARFNTLEYEKFEHYYILYFGE